MLLTSANPNSRVVFPEIFESEKAVTKTLSYPESVTFWQNATLRRGPVAAHTLGNTPGRLMLYSPPGGLRQCVHSPSP